MLSQGQASQQVAVVAGSIPIAVDDDPVAVSDYAPIKDFENFMAVLLLGTMTDTDTADFKIQVATDASGTGKTDVVTSTQVVYSTTVQDQMVLECNQAQCLAALAGATHISCEHVSSAGQAGLSAMVLLGIGPKYGPAKDYDHASVLEVKAAT